jgi:hypothetical protein
MLVLHLGQNYGAMKLQLAIEAMVACSMQNMMVACMAILFLT